MTTLIYAGIGARATPPAVLRDMTKMAGWLARTGWHLASGRRGRGRHAFAGGAGRPHRTLYLPWRGYNGHGGPDCRRAVPSELSACIDIAARLHPAWHRCSSGAVRKLHARNAAVLLGVPLSTVRSMRSSPGHPGWRGHRGGTGMALRIAAEHGVPVLNLAVMCHRATACERLLAIRRCA